MVVCSFNYEKVSRDMSKILSWTSPLLMLKGNGERVKTRAITAINFINYIIIMSGQFSQQLLILSS